MCTVRCRCGCSTRVSGTWSLLTSMVVWMLTWLAGRSYSWMSSVYPSCTCSYFYRVTVYCSWREINVVILFRKSRKTIDTMDTMKTFGPVEIHYGKVQQKVTLKYDSWHKEILSRFGGLYTRRKHARVSWHHL